tara:strand:+ start:100 stop:348 length:249 start_codon:yes stop_codon:yes gene_type:complete
MDWDFVFAQLKRFYRCSKSEFKEMTLYETFQLLEDGEKLARAESGEKPSGGETSKKYTGAAGHAELKALARRKKIKLPEKRL